MLIGEYLIQKTQLTEPQLKIGLSEQQVTGERIGEILIRFGFITRSQLNGALQELCPEALIGSFVSEQTVPLDFLKNSRTKIQADLGHVVYLSTLSPNPLEVKTEAERLIQRPVQLVECNHEELLEYVKNLDLEAQTNHLALNDEEDVNKLINAIIYDACKLDASDIHIENTEKTIHIRYRVDSILHISKTLSLSKAGRLMARIKDLAGIDVTEKRKPQNGAFPKTFRGQALDFRVATLPAIYGEKITIRILNKEKVMRDVRTLGITRIDDWLDLTKHTTGLVLVCGATGSGKTTTLYSTLLALDKLQRSVYSVEDPVEYKLPFITQTAVNDLVGFGFSEYNRTILRHDPDIVVVGEVRDARTAQTTLTLADTGHLVFATLHTNDAQATRVRIEGFDIDTTQLAYLLRGILVQRLARQLCSACHGVGCPQCLDTGYSGRTLLTEFVKFDSPEDYLRFIDGKLPYHRFIDDSIHKLKTGQVSYEELERVNGFDLLSFPEARDSIPLELIPKDRRHLLESKASRRKLEL